MEQNKKSYLVWILGGITGVLVLTVIILLVVGANMIFNAAKNINFNPPPPAPKAEEFVAPPPKVSKFATDSGILKIRGDLVKLRSDIDSVDIFEPQLSPPNIDLNIKI